MAALTNLFGEYASDEEGEVSGDLQGALPDAARWIFSLLDYISVVHRESCPAQNALCNTQSAPAFYVLSPKQCMQLATFFQVQPARQLT